MNKLKGRKVSCPNCEGIWYLVGKTENTLCPHCGNEVDAVENRDVSLLEFIAREKRTKDFIQIKELVNNFKEFLKEEEEETKFINTRWFGRALKRLALIKEKRRLSKGREVVLDWLRCVGG